MERKPYHECSRDHTLDVKLERRALEHIESNVYKQNREREYRNRGQSSMEAQQHSYTAADVASMNTIPTTKGQKGKKM